MLKDFLTREREAILTVAKQKAKEAKWSPLDTPETETRWTKLYDKFESIIGMNSTDAALQFKLPEVDEDPLSLGFAVSEIVQTYGIIYRAITEAAKQLNYDITADEYRQLNISLDKAIADVVNDFEDAHTVAQVEETVQHDRREAERLGFLVHELRNSLQSATLAFEMMESGDLDVKGNTAGILKRSLLRLSELVDKALTGVRLKLEPEMNLERVCAADIVHEVGVTANFLARTRDQIIYLQPKANPSILVDRPLLISAVSNLVQNALKFTPKGGSVHVRTEVVRGHAVIEVEDECGGLDEETLQYLFVPGTQMSSDRSGAGLGLAITRQAIEQNGGEIKVTNLPGKGCIFALVVPLPEDPKPE